jgi:two-component system, NtrC family, response regulator AtoC
MSGASSGRVRSDDVIFGCTASMQRIWEQIRKVARTDVPVLIRGETGTGKEIIAEVVHRQSERRWGQLVKVHCPAIPGTLLESELFGYEEGAFTGAATSKPGQVEIAQRGTLFLDEIAELSTSAQAKLLRLLQDGQFCRLGSVEQKQSGARIVCATHRHLEDEIKEGNFRQDLLYRINVVTLRLPPLRERREDIPQLVDYFLRELNHRHSRRAPSLSQACLQRLQAYDWPGNIRQLENLMTAFVVLEADESFIHETLSHGNDDYEPVFGQPLSLRSIGRLAARQAERRALVQILKANQGNRKQTARDLNMSYRALLYRLKDAGIPHRRASSVSTAAAPSGNDQN